MNNIAPGQQIGPYRIINQIGQGGMATVYKAYHAAMDRYVAIKVLPSQFAQNKEFTQRFEQEARTIANLEHAHILPVYDYGEHDSITYLVMRYLDAGTLKDRIQRGDLSLTEADKLFTQLAGALAYAHEMNVIHRDIKPSNAMVNSRGELFLTDFGIAKLLESTAQFTATGAITGTPAYMSPEQAQGEKLDSRSDIYSLGIVLYEMVTGKVPFEAETPLAVILKHINAPLPPPTTLKPDLPPEIEKVILKALAKNRDDRFATCDEFLNAWKIALTQTQTAQVIAPTPVKKESAAPTLAASPTTTAAPAASTVKAETPRQEEKGGNPLKKVLIAIAGAVGVISFLCIAGVGAMYAVNYCPPQGPWMMPPWCEAKTTSAVNLTATASPSSPSVTSSAPNLSASGASGWTSWSAVNDADVLAFDQDRLISGGHSGLAFWNPGTLKLNKTVTQGMQNPHVTAIFVDEDRSLWIGNEEGAVNIVGDKITPYGPVEGLGGTYVNVIARVDKRLLVGTSYSEEGGGLYEFDNGKFKKVSFPSVHEDQKGKLSYNVTAIAADKKGVLWVGTTNGLGRFDGKQWTRFGEENGLPHNGVWTLLIDDKDRVWVGTEGGAALLKGDRFEHIVKSGTGTTRKIIADSKGHIWFTSYGSIGRVNVETNDVQLFDHRNSDLPADFFYTSAARDASGNLFFGSAMGIFRYGADGKFVFSSVPNVPAIARGYSRIMLTPRGELWFVEMYDVRIDQFIDEKWSLIPPPCECQPMAFDNSGNLWGALWDHGLWFVSRDGQTKTLIAKEQGMPSNNVNAISFLPDGSAAVATQNGLALIQNRKVTQTHTKANSGFPHDDVTAVLVAADKTIWVGTNETVSRLKADGKWEHFLLAKIFNHGMGDVYDIAQARDGAIWVATENGAYQFKEGQWQEYLPSNPQVRLPSQHVLKITVAPDGVLWFATMNGAASFDGKEWTKYLPEPSKLVNNRVQDILVSPNGTVWFATSGGVSRWKP